jgi:phosphatidylglycerophosphate synthase
MSRPSIPPIAIDLRDAPLALERVAGLPVAVRNVILAHRGGARSVVLLGPADECARLDERLAPELRRRNITLQVARATRPDELPARAILWPADLSVGRRPPEPLERVAGPPDPTWVRVRDAPSARLAERHLLHSLRKPEDGLVARLDRAVSLFISRRLLRLAIGPNPVSVLALAVGVLCGLLAATGRNPAMVAGAFLFWFNGILDGVDGEIARARHLESRLGEWLDTLCDDLTNLCFAVGLGVGLWRQSGRALYLGLGLLGGAAIVIGAAFMYHYLITRAHSGDLNAYRMPHEHRAASAPGPLARLLLPLRQLVRRDVFSTLAMLLAFVGQLRVMAWLMAIGGTAVWVTITVENLLAWRRAARPEPGTVKQNA